MRRMLRIFFPLFWLGLGLSTILFVGTGVLWVRSVGYWEGWSFTRFEPHPEWKTGPGTPHARRHWWYIRASDQKFWLAWGDRGTSREEKPEARYYREPRSGDGAKKNFESLFHPVQDPSSRVSNWRWHFAGMGFCHRRFAATPGSTWPQIEDFYLAIPFWLLAVLFGLWPACFVARRVLRRRRYGAGLCPSCGYDLRATPKRCPECGREVASTKP